MEKYRFKLDEKYSPFYKDEEYNGDYVAPGFAHNVATLAESYQCDWEKVTDPWVGVEFIDRGTSKWPICRVSRIEQDYVWYFNSEEKEVCFTKEYLKISTEQAYVEQLKGIAIKKFGEIKPGEKFNTGYGIHSTGENHPDEWYYNKYIDFLYYKGLIVYAKGCWATKLPQRIEVTYKKSKTKGSMEFHTYKFKVSGTKGLPEGPAGDFLAKQYEKYLNNEIS